MKLNSISVRGALSCLGTPAFFWLVVILLVVQAIWIALSGRYPMAFDEDYHLGLINLYAHHLSPFWTSQPAGGDAFGAVARDPSYLYQYLMSFPYRLIALFTSNPAAQIIFLRIINIGLFASGLVLYRRLLLKTRASSSVVNLVLLVFVLIPIVPLLAAQVNYDNLILPFSGLALLLTLRTTSRLRPQSLDLKSLLILLITCLAASLVKYPFLPFFAVIVCYLLVRIKKVYRTPARLVLAIRAGWRTMGHLTAIGLLLLTTLASGLFVERYGVNLVQYHTPVPDCLQVLKYEQCKEYGPWIRDYNLEQNKQNSETSPVSYTQHWIYGMWFRSVFAVDGPATQFQTRGPLTLPAWALASSAILGSIAFILAVRRLWGRYDASVLWLIGMAAAVHITILWADNYLRFLETGKPVAINGRYLLPVLPIIMLLGILSLKEILRAHRKLQAGFATLLIICLMAGGGGLTYILRSNDAWYWDNAGVRRANHAVQRALGPITPGYGQPTQFLH